MTAIDALLHPSVWLRLIAAAAIACWVVQQLRQLPARRRRRGLRLVISRKVD